MIYNNYHYLELCVIIHTWLRLVEVFFKGVHLECEPEALKSLYRSPGNKKKQLVLQW